MKTRRLIKGTSEGGILEQAYTPSNLPPYADTAETLTEPFTVGKDTTTATTGYVKFASVSLPAAYRSANARFEVLDKNPVNAQTQMCGVEVVVKNTSTTNVDVVPRLLYGSSAYLSKIYACVKKGSYPVLVDLYFDITSTNPQETISCIKPLFTFTRTTGSTTFTFISDNEPVTALPTDTTNTQLSTVYVLVTEAADSAKLNGKAASEYALMTIKTATEWKTDNIILAAGVFGYDSTNKVTKIGDGTTAWNALPAFSTTSFTFATAAWVDISRIAAAGDAQKYFNVGDEKTVELSTGEVITLVILGFNHDDLTSGGKAPITIGMKNLLATRYRMNSSNTTVGGWNNSEMRTSTMATLLSQLPLDLQGVIKQVNKKTTEGGGSSTITTSADKLWLFSEVEIDGTTVSGYTSEGEQYEYWKTVKDGKTSADRIKYLPNGGALGSNWWLRSPHVNGSSTFRYVTSVGGVSNNYASLTYGVSFGFCI